MSIDLATGSLTGTPTTSGTFTSTITASNGVTPDATQSFTLNVDAAPVFTSANHATFTKGKVGTTFTPSASGFPTPTITKTAGSLHTGVTFTGGQLKGTPTVGGTFHVTFTASNGVLQNTTQSFTLTVAQAPTRMVLIVAGQSNATGFGSFAVDPFTAIDYLAAPCATAADSVDSITWDQTWMENGGQPSEVPLDTPQLSIATGNPQIFGPEIGLARTVYAETGMAVTIIKVAFPGTPLAGDWVPGGGLWDDMLSFVKSTLAKDAMAGVSDRLGGFYWVQGEADAAVPKEAGAYQTNLMKFVTTLRSDLPLGTASPMVLAKTWTAQYPTGNTEVRAADSYVAAHLAHTYTVDTKNLPRLPGALHIENTGELTLGDDMAKVAIP